MKGSAMSSPSGTTDQLEFTDRQKQGFAGLTVALRAVGSAFLVLGLVRLLGGVLELVRTLWGLGIVSLLEGVIALVLGKVLLTGGDDANFVAETRGYDRPHLLNLVRSVTFYLILQFALGAAVAIGLLIVLVWA
jgi:hypothetical protein